MTSISDRLADAETRARKLYTQRTQLEEQRQQIQVAAQQNAQQARAIDMELVKIDGETELLEKLIKEETNG